VNLLFDNLLHPQRITNTFAQLNFVEEYLSPALLIAKLFYELVGSSIYFWLSLKDGLDKDHLLRESYKKV